MTWVIWNLASFRLETVIGACFVLNVLVAQKSFWTHSMVPLGDEALVEARFGLFIHSANLDAG